MSPMSCILLIPFIAWVTILDAYPTNGDNASSEERNLALAYNHALRVFTEAPCVPQPRVVPVLHPSKSYTPHVTVLHRCSKDTGCCESLYDRCVPVEKQPVTLPFIANTLEGNGELVESVEFLTLVNHTRCGCINYRNVKPEHLTESE
ncbi:hypothetical protein LAZ67_16000729 [Cordylochernes scorpioides]|uniref:Platelet-derived growth factor (PDGF) family profile domain-containing protein n=1 Tax=Cordylochernes scorpioides TaxID=51811 RepID=A0ABY6LAT2_9ARAC|nr:hypothetical protein LAZ67_16000729 [Cordylochernes scorpioides]